MADPLVDTLFDRLPPGLTRLGVAVSGGGDSMALLHLLHQGAAAHGVSIDAATVDHGLRMDAAAEAATVAEVCAELGVPHETLRWRDWDGTGNLQNAAREARFALLADWALRRGLPAVALGHTRDDVAETIVMRLARGAGVDGLAGIPDRLHRRGVTFLRPMLGLRRTDLRAHLEARGHRWIDDPSNDDTRFARVKVRRALGQLGQAGITPDALSMVADNMASARDALDWAVDGILRDQVQVVDGAVVADAAGFAKLPVELARRVLVRAIAWVRNAAYPPRRAPLLAAIDDLRAGRTATLEGCMVTPRRGKIWIFREYHAVARLTAPCDRLWDGRWKLDSPAAKGHYEVRALGDAGLALCPDWRDLDRPRALLCSAPAVWSGDILIAAPVAKPGSKWRAQVVTDTKALFAAGLSH